MSETEGSSQPSVLLIQGQASLSIGDYKSALTYLLEAFALDPGHKAIQTSLFEVLSCTEGYYLPLAFTDAIAKVAEHGNHNIQSLAAIIRNQFDCNEDIATLQETLAGHEVNQPLPDATSKETAAIFENRLVRLILTKAISISPELEGLITTVRHMHILAWAENAFDVTLAATHPNILPLIACQAFNTQYVYPVSTDEQILAGKLAETILTDVNSISPAILSLAGCYIPLAELFAETPQEQLDAITLKAEEWPQIVQDMWAQQILEVRYEALIKESLQSLTEIPEATEGTIREQYENFPYPRWQTTQRHPSATLKQFITSKFSENSFPNVPEGPVDILIAGCGTGQQVIELAQSLESKNTLAIDISKSSLAYAYRKAQQYGLENTHFSLADVTKIADWDAAFDLIVCTGVLHHLVNPSDGIKGLLGVSKPSSLFMLAAYSERGREAAIAARNFIAQHDIPSTLPALREMREAIRGLPFHHPVAPIQESLEFYSASGLVDYIFNKQETQYTPLGLQKLLDEHGLKFLGFHQIAGVHQHQFQEMFPDGKAMSSLENWEKYETEYPEVFGEMMQFWCCHK